MFRVAGADAEHLAVEFHPIPPSELADQPPFKAWMRRYAGGRRVIAAEPRLFEPAGRLEAVVEQSRRRFWAET